MILIDNTVLSNFVVAEVLPCLEHYCLGKGLITEAVWNEINRGKTAHFVGEDVLHIFPIRRFENQEEETQYLRLC